MPEEDEFGFIRRVLQPLTRGAPNTFELGDDAALLAAEGPLSDVVVTADMLVAGVHFLDSDPYDAVARKALRVNLSDLAAMGATPFAYVMSVAWPRTAGRVERERFAAGLETDQAAFGLTLLGGDTTGTPGPLVVNVTAFGRCGPQGPLLRSGARPGDLVLVTGTIGDAGLGLRALQGDAAFGAEADELIARYRLPEPRMAAAAAFAELATACIDVSDGLIADAGHIAERSGVAIRIEAPRIPLSRAATAWRDAQANRDAATAELCALGDDYELLATTSAGRAERVIEACARVGIACAVIGRVEPGEGVSLLDAAGARIALVRSGFTHF